MHNMLQSAQLSRLWQPFYYRQLGERYVTYLRLLEKIERKTMRNLLTKLCIETSGIIIAALIMCLVFCGCASAPTGSGEKQVIIAVNSIVGGDTFGNIPTVSSGLVTCGNVTMTNNPHITISVSFRDPSTSSLSQTINPNTSVPLSLTK